MTITIVIEKDSDIVNVTFKAGDAQETVQMTKQELIKYINGLTDDR